MLTCLNTKLEQKLANIIKNTGILNYEESRTKTIENHEITLIRTNPNDLNFNIKNLIAQILIFIKEAIKKQTKTSLIDDLSKKIARITI